MKLKDPVPARLRFTCCVTKCRKVTQTCSRTHRQIEKYRNQHCKRGSLKNSESLWCADDIEIIFKRGSWEAKAEFAQTDVHRQIAIVFKSPPYQEQDITEEQDVSVFLRRLSDHMDSEPVTFTYLPHNPGPPTVLL